MTELKGIDSKATRRALNVIRALKGYSLGGLNGRYPQGVPNEEAERLLNLSFDDFKAEFIAPIPTKSPLRLIAA
ncbi:hypothetical protein [Aggregatibacter actinomycetemcomitans]|uniref:hypothetical protein n=1 Tax=Aggregatibacter actinomycetemcomitans TaxID=714 RepID=UPI001E526A13|nr:hypothetical protein [Aggregatibacter actinomycetemcomitans]